MDENIYTLNHSISFFITKLSRTEAHRLCSHSFAVYSVEYFRAMTMSSCFRTMQTITLKPLLLVECHGHKRKLEEMFVFLNFSVVWLLHQNGSLNSLHVRPSLSLVPFLSPDPYNRYETRHHIMWGRISIIALLFV